MTLEQLERQTDEELAKMASDNEDAFYVLMNRYETRLLRYIKRISGSNQQNAEDILQESFIKAYRNINDFNPSLKFSSWIYRITHNEAISYWRKIRRLNDNVSIDEVETGLINILTAQDKTDRLAVSQEVRQKVQGVLTRMPENYREIIILRYLEEKDYEEIADIIQKPVGTVSAMIHRAKAKFADLGVEFNLDTMI